MNVTVYLRIPGTELQRKWRSSSQEKKKKKSNSDNDNDNGDKDDEEDDDNDNDKQRFAVLVCLQPQLLGGHCLLILYLYCSFFLKLKFFKQNIGIFSLHTLEPPLSLSLLAGSCTS